MDRFRREEWHTVKCTVCDPVPPDKVIARRQARSRLRAIDQREQSHDDKRNTIDTA